MNLDYKKLQDEMTAVILEDIKTTKMWKDSMSADDKTDMTKSIEDGVKKIAEPITIYLNDNLINAILEDQKFQAFLVSREG